MCGEPEGVCAETRSTGLTPHRLLLCDGGDDADQLAEDVAHGWLGCRHAAAERRRRAQAASRQLRAPP